jgi:lipoprotein-anchoring transpeptidase ErfK/SrfK
MDWAHLEKREFAMRIATLVLAASIAVFAFAKDASAAVTARVNISSQTMQVYVEGELRHVWPISSGRMGYRTPSGSYRPTVLRSFHRSSKYGGSPMPYSIFFRGGYAIHGSYDVRSLGRPASHGCIRLHPANARELFQMVRYFGPGSTRIVIHR